MIYAMIRLLLNIFCWLCLGVHAPKAYGSCFMYLCVYLHDCDSKANFGSLNMVDYAQPDYDAGTSVVL